MSSNIIGGYFPTHFAFLIVVEYKKWSEKERKKKREATQAMDTSKFE